MPVVPKTFIYDHWATKRPDEDDRRMQSTGDFFDGSYEIKKLDRCSFDEVLGRHNVVLVFFYDPRHQECYYCKKHFSTAAHGNPDRSRLYAAVNCVKEPDLCIREGATDVPFFKMYSKRFPVGTIREFTTFTADMMYKYVMNCPILTEPVRPKRPCDLK